MCRYTRSAWLPILPLVLLSAPSVIACDIYRAQFVGSVSGSYKACDSSQLAPRDAGLDQSVVGCP